MYRNEVTVADTGLPGKPRISFFLPSYMQVANVVGLPGFINTLNEYQTY